MGRKVCVLTSAHPVFDTRIFHKECKSLVRAGYEVMLIASARENGIHDGVEVSPLPRWKSRLERVTRGTTATFWSARKADADVYHFHDPELIPIALLLRLLGATVIYDIHEDLPRTISYKSYIPLSLKGLVSRIVEFTENWTSRRFSGLVAATPTIGARFRRLNRNLVVLNNYPRIEEIEMPDVHTPANREASLLYVGMRITRARGAEEMVRAMGLLSSDLQAKLRLVGSWDNADLPEALSRIPGWNRTEFVGLLDRKAIAGELQRATAGLVILHPEPNYVMSQPVKLFEYMCAGIPVIASNFPVCREIVNQARCGILVDPLDPEEIAAAIEYLLTHSEEAKEMGQRGFRAVRERYNWANEEKALLRFYDELLPENAAYQERLVGRRQST